jgi:hypothetical protein
VTARYEPPKRLSIEKNRQTADILISQSPGVALSHRPTGTNALASIGVPSQLPIVRRPLKHRPRNSPLTYRAHLRFNGVNYPLRLDRIAMFLVALEPYDSGHHCQGWRTSYERESV